MNETFKTQAASAADLYTQGIIGALGETAERHSLKISRVEVRKTHRVGPVITVDLERADGGYFIPLFDAQVAATDMLVDAYADQHLTSKTLVHWHRFIEFSGYCPEDLTWISVRVRADDYEQDDIDRLVGHQPTPPPVPTQRRAA